MSPKLKYPVSEKVIAARLREIETALERLSDLAKLSEEEFHTSPDDFAIAEHHLRKALEASISICTHIVSRIPGEKTSVYKSLGPTLARHRILTKKMGETYREMAGYRNRLVHFYYKVEPKEMYKILTEDLGDFEEFSRQIAKFVEDQKKEND